MEDLALLVAMILFFPAILAPLALVLTFMKRQRWHIFFILPVSIMASSIIEAMYDLDSSSRGRSYTLS